MSKDILVRYFSFPTRHGGYEWKSPYFGALIDARKATGRDIHSGEKIIAEGHGSWLGALGYMALVDHVGGIVRKKRIIDSSKNDFLEALGSFTNLNEKERKILYALRCSFAHNYHLYNNRIKDKDKLHHFRVTSGLDGQSLIIHPKKQWSGRHGKRFKNDLNTTTVNIEIFGDLIEKMHQNIVDCVNNNQVFIKDKSLINTFIVYKT